MGPASRPAAPTDSRDSQVPWSVAVAVPSLAVNIFPRDPPWMEAGGGCCFLLLASSCCTPPGFNWTPKRAHPTALHAPGPHTARHPTCTHTTARQARHQCTLLEQTQNRVQNARRRVPPTSMPPARADAESRPKRSQARAIDFHTPCSSRRRIASETPAGVGHLTINAPYRTDAEVQHSARR